MAGGEAIILGSGTSNGVPMLGVHYSPEFLANPKNHRMRSSCLLQGPEGNFLIDCTPELRLQLVREKIYSVQEVLITHTHADHVMGMDDLRSFCIIEGRSLPVYTLPRYQDDIKRIFPYAFDEHPTGVWVPRFELRDATDVIESCGLSIQVFEVQHGRVHPNHFHFQAAMDTIEELKPSKAFLTHLSHEYDHNSFEENLPSHVRLAYDGLRIGF